MVAVISNRTAVLGLEILEQLPGSQSWKEKPCYLIYLLGFNPLIYASMLLIQTPLLIAFGTLVLLSEESILKI